MLYEDVEMIDTNTWFNLPERGLYTWVTPHNAHDTTKLERNQIDYILIKKNVLETVSKLSKLTLEN